MLSICILLLKISRWCIILFFRDPENNKSESLRTIAYCHCCDLSCTQLNKINNFEINIPKALGCGEPWADTCNACLRKCCKKVVCVCYIIIDIINTFHFSVLWIFFLIHLHFGNLSHHLMASWSKTTWEALLAKRILGKYFNWCIISFFTIKCLSLHLFLSI